MSDDVSLAQRMFEELRADWQDQLLERTAVLLAHELELWSTQSGKWDAWLLEATAERLAEKLAAAKGA